MCKLRLERRKTRPVPWKLFKQYTEKTLRRKVEFEKVFEPMKPGDVPKTYASTKKLEEMIHFKPTIPIQEGLQKFTDWYVKYYNKKKFFNESYSMEMKCQF